MDAIEYFKGMRKRLCEDHLKLLPKKSVGYQATLREMSFYDEAIGALAQEPKTVLYSGDGYADGYMVYDMAECPNCGYEYEDGDKDWGLPFCPNCGQSLNWESEE